MERAVVREVRGLRGTGSRYGEEERGGGDRRLCRGRNSLNRRRRRRWYREAWRVGVPPGGARGGSRDPTRLVREGGVGASWVSALPRGAFLLTASEELRMARAKKSGLAGRAIPVATRFCVGRAAGGKEDMWVW